ncbi:MAG: outer membrane beta-barrel protein [Beijerinckiaceae bacterium]
MVPTYIQASCVGLMCLGAMGAASAADLPARSRAPAPMLVEPFSWTGFSVGVNAGFAYDKYEFSIAAVSPVAGAFLGRATVHSSGFIGGGQVGYDYQTPWHIVVGVAADLDGAGIRGSSAASGALIGGAGGIGGVSTSTRVNALGSVRLRVGYAFDHLLFADNVLVYLTGGAAYGSIRDNFSGFAGGAFGTFSRSRTPFGLGREPGTVGIGIEKMISHNLSLDIQYRYQYMGASTPTVPFLPAGFGRFGTRSMYHLGRIGLNYRFDTGGGAPVVARY